MSTCLSCVLQQLPHCCRRLDLSRCVGVRDGGLVRLAAYTRQPAAGGPDGEEEDEGEVWEEQLEAEIPAAAAVMAATKLEGMQLSPPGEAAAAGRAGSVIESPDSAVRRIAAQRHADMMHRTAAAGACPRCGWRRV